MNSERARMTPAARDSLRRLDACRRTGRSTPRNRRSRAARKVTSRPAKIGRSRSGPRWNTRSAQFCFNDAAGHVAGAGDRVIGVARHVETVENSSARRARPRRVGDQDHRAALARESARAHRRPRRRRRRRCARRPRRRRAPRRTSRASGSNRSMTRARSRAIIAASAAAVCRRGQHWASAPLTAAKGASHRGRGCGGCGAG